MSGQVQHDWALGKCKIMQNGPFRVTFPCDIILGVADLLSGLTCKRLSPPSNSCQLDLSNLKDSVLNAVSSPKLF
jgi:hypothetical protein